MRQQATYQDLVALPENMIGEIIEGELYASPRPGVAHANAATALAAILRSRFGRRGGGDNPGGWHILFEPELHLGEDVLVPDIAGWRHATLPTLPRTPAVEVAPDWICEILSAGTARLDRAKKLPVYATHRVSWAWIVDPEQQLLEVKRLEARRWSDLAVYAGATPARIPPFDAIEIDLAEIWGSPAPS